MVWSKLKFLLLKLRVGITKIFALGEEYETGGRVRLKPNKIEKILNWPVPQDQARVRAFLGTIQSTRQKVEWKWTESEELAFQILRGSLCNQQPCSDGTLYYRLTFIQMLLTLPPCAILPKPKMKKQGFLCMTHSLDCQQSETMILTGKS